MNHLYIQTAFLGDLLLSIPTLKQIRYWDSKSKVTVLCRKGYGQLLKDLSVCDEVIEVDKKTKKDIGKKLEDKPFDTIFCPHQSMTSHKIVKALNAKTKIGYQKMWNSSYFTHRVKRQLDWPEAIRQLQLLGPVSESIMVKLEAFTHKSSTIPTWAQMNLPNLSWTDSEVEQLVSRKSKGFKTSGSYVCIAPGSVWPTKRWLPEKFIKVSTELARQGHRIVILGAPDERALCEKIQLQVPNSFSLAGHLSITESLMVLSKSRGLVCNDSGAMHMASLFNLPTVALFGPTVQELGYKPWNPKAKVFENENLLCRPCGQHGAKSCPIGTHQCMSSIDEKALTKEALTLFN